MKEIKKHKTVYNTGLSGIEGFDLLSDFALDMRCSWNHSADEIWRQLEPDLWDSTHYPWVVLQTVSKDKFKKIMSDPAFCKKVDALKQSKEEDITGPAWFQKTFPESPLTTVAYFSMEFMLSESLPIYSGGLGNVAGDHLKAASDMGVPVVGIGLLYQQGYFRQEIDQNGEQQALYPYNDPGQLPVVPLRDANGEWLRLKIELPGYSVWLRTWLVQVGIITELDWWWAEAYTPEVGWALGDGKEHGDDPAIDDIEAEQLYNILEQQVVPEFYNRNEKGIPTRWTSRMRESMALLTPRFPADRTVREYTEQHYLPAAKSFLERVADNGKIGKQIAEKLQKLNQKWDSLHFGEIKVGIVGNQYKFNVQVFFSDLDPDLVQVELFANGANGSKPEIIKMKRETKTGGSSKTYNYNALASSERPASDYTPRALAYIDSVSVPLETTLITWQH